MALETWESTSEQHLLVADLTSIVTDIERRLAARDDADRVFEIEDVGMELDDDAYYEALDVANPFLDELATPVWTADAVEVVCAACHASVIARRCR